jgi:hypothetical protein
MTHCGDRRREVGYEEPIRFSDEIRFAAVGVRSMVDAVVPLIDKIIFFQCDDKK